MEKTKEHIPFEITEALIDALNGFIDSKDDKAILEQLQDVHYADIAEILDDLNLDQATYVIKLLDSQTTSDILAELEEDVCINQYPVRLAIKARRFPRTVE